MLLNLMTENKKRRPVTTLEGERRGNLPEHLIGSILERLPIQEAVRTSIVSKNWRYKWTTMKSILFDHQISQKLVRYGAFGRHGLMRVIHQVLLLHEGSIDKFHLYIPYMSYDSFQEVDHWISFLSRKGVKDLTIVNLNQRYHLPPCMFSCLELRNLELSNCIFKPPLQFQGFLYLETLTLNDIDFTRNLGGIEINLPELKKLAMQSCTNVYNLFKPKATKLETLFVMNCPDVMLIELLHSEHLTFVSVTHEKPIKDIVRLERMDLALMFTKMPKVQKFFIDGNFLKLFIAEKPKCFLTTVASLKHLRLSDFSLRDWDHLHGLLCLLRNSPNLETLCMMNILLESKLMNDGVETTSSHLKSPDFLDETLNRLQYVELSPLHGSRLELLLIKLLLAYSPSLEKFTIRVDGNLDAKKRSNIAKDVRQLPRVSSKAQMVFLDPKSCGSESMNSVKLNVFNYENI